jgi:hypothetical protein
VQAEKAVGADFSSVDFRWILVPIAQVTRRSQMTQRDMNDSELATMLDARTSPFPYSNTIAGNAARKILFGEIEMGELEVIIARCHWCNTVVGRCYSRRPECWHLAARVLLNQGLRPLVDRAAAGQLTFEEAPTP